MVAYKKKNSIFIRKKVIKMQEMLDRKSYIGIQ